MADENEIFDEEIDLSGLSLESILAEYKGSAYIDGDRRTPAGVLNERTDLIVSEAPGGEVFESPRQTAVYPPPPAAPPQYTGSGELDKDIESTVMFFDNYKPPGQESKDAIIDDVEKAVEREIRFGEDSGEVIKIDFDAYEPARNAEYGYINDGYINDGYINDGYINDGYINDGYINNSYVSDSDDDEVFEEPPLSDAAEGFTEKLDFISIRLIPSAVVSLIMIIMTFAAEAGLIIPLGIGRNATAVSGVLIILLLIVMMLCSDLIIRGAADLIRGAPNAETLILFSCAFSLISGVFTMLGSSAGMLPYCTVSAVSLTLAAYGEKLSLRAITETLKTTLVTSEPYGVQAEYNGDINKSVLKKAFNRTDGFYSNLMHPDVSETAYRYAAPVLLAFALVLAILCVVAKGRGEYFLHTLSGMLAAAAPFSAMLSFSLPFVIVSKAVRKSGAAIAGWGGVDDICFTDGASVTDDDLFPPGTLAFSGMKAYGNTRSEKAIMYTASIVMASGSGLSRIFYEVIKSQRMEPIRVENFACYEGGIGGQINGEQVMTGSAAFMNLLGIRIPDDMNMKNAMFTAVNGSLIAMFAVEYSPVSSVQSALILMLKWRIKLFFAMRDFNITPLMLEQKFRVSLQDIEYVQAKDSYSISDSFSGREGRMAAILTREGLGPYAEAITGGRLLKAAAIVATVISVVSAALGVLLMFFMYWNGAFLSARSGNLLLFMLATLAAVIVVCGYVKCRK